MKILKCHCGLIEAQINKEGYTPVVRCEMGRVGELAGSKSVTSYIGTRTIKDLSNDSLFKLGVEMDSISPEIGHGMPPESRSTIKEWINSIISEQSK